MPVDLAQYQIEVDRAMLKGHGIPIGAHGFRTDVLALFALKWGWHLAVEHRSGRWYAEVREALSCPACRHWTGEGDTEAAAVAHALALALSADAHRMPNREVTIS